jgi:hypothetical protein
VKVCRLVFTTLVNKSVIKKDTHVQTLTYLAFTPIWRPQRSPQRYSATCPRRTRQGH